MPAILRSSVRCTDPRQRRYGVKRLCTILGVARSSSYHWRRTAADRAARQAADARLAARIRAVHRESDGTHGVPRITAELGEAGEHVNHKRIARVMRGAGLAGVRLRRRHRTTGADPAAANAPDLVGRDFTASEPNTKYVGDITCLPLDGGKFDARTVFRVLLDGPFVRTLERQTPPAQIPVHLLLGQPHPVQLDRIEDLSLSPTRRPRGRATRGSRPPAVHFAHQLPTALSETWNTVAASSCADGDNSRVSVPVRSRRDPRPAS